MEGAGELPVIIMLAKELESAGPSGGAGGWHNYPAIVRRLSAGDFHHMGETYLDRTRQDRKTNRPFFIDKMPNNWFHLGLIRLILPNARMPTRVGIRSPAASPTTSNIMLKGSRSRATSSTSGFIIATMRD